jgi:predicted NBD/HSP70 family sugar kinase
MRSVASVASVSPTRAGTATAVSGGALLELIRERPRTRAELLESTGLSRSTLTERLDALIGHGLVRCDALAANGRGRPPTLLSFNRDAGAILAAGIGHAHARLAVTDLGGEIMGELVDDVAVAEGPEQVVRWLDDRFQRLLAETRVPRSRVRAMGLGLPGPVEFRAGRLVSPPTTVMPGWDRYPLADVLGARLKAPVLVDNDANVMAVGEHRMGWSTVDDLLFVKIGTGLGAGIISDGRIQRGAQGAAGDIGHIRIPGHDDVPCVCGKTGCLGALSSGLALAMRLNARGIAAEGVADVVKLVNAGHPEAIAAVQEAGRTIGGVLAMVVNVLNPSLIVIGGALAGAGEHLLSRLREQIYGRSTALATRELRVLPSTAGERAGVLGAGAMALEHVLAPDAVDRALAA